MKKDFANHLQSSSWHKEGGERKQKENLTKMKNLKLEELLQKTWWKSKGFLMKKWRIETVDDSEKVFLTKRNEVMYLKFQKTSFPSKLISKGVVSIKIKCNSVFHPWLQLEAKKETKQLRKDIALVWIIVQN